jgi:hypothetical protein
MGSIVMRFNICFSALYVNLELRLFKLILQLILTISSDVGQRFAFVTKLVSKGCDLDDWRIFET